MKSFVILLSTLLLFLKGCTLFSQTTISATLGVSKMYLSSQDYRNVRSFHNYSTYDGLSEAVAPTIGIFLNQQLSEQATISLGLSYSWLRTDLDVSYIEDTPLLDVYYKTGELRYDLLKIQPLFRYKIYNGLGVQAGVNFGTFGNVEVFGKNSYLTQKDFEVSEFNYRVSWEAGLFYQLKQYHLSLTYDGQVKQSAIPATEYGKEVGIFPLDLLNFNVGYTFRTSSKK